jgi:hypothetical protein
MLRKFVYFMPQMLDTSHVHSLLITSFSLVIDLNLCCFINHSPRNNRLSHVNMCVYTCIRLCGIDLCKYTL